MRIAGLAVVLSCISCPAGACEAWTLGAGVAMLSGHNGSTRADVRIGSTVGTALAGLPRHFELDGLSAEPETARTLALSLGCQFDANLALMVEAGWPPRVAVKASGVIVPPGPVGPLLALDLDDELPRSAVDQRVWAPVLALRYRFGEAGARIRPFVSVGASYTWFTDERVRSGFDDAIDAHFGQPLAISRLRPGRTRTHVDVEPQWAPVAGVGIEWRTAPRWTLGASLGYSPLRVEADFRTRAADGDTLARARSHTDLDVLGAAVLLTYRWSPPSSD